MSKEKTAVDIEADRMANEIESLMMDTGKPKMNTSIAISFLLVEIAKIKVALKIDGK